MHRTHLRRSYKIAPAKSTRSSGRSPFYLLVRQLNAMSVRVLRKGGVFLYLTFGQPHFRRRYLTRPDTALEIRQLGEAFHYYLYILRK